MLPLPCEPARMGAVTPRIQYFFSGSRSGKGTPATYNAGIRRRLFSYGYQRKEHAEFMAHHKSHTQTTNEGGRPDAHPNR